MPSSKSNPRPYDPDEWLFMRRASGGPPIFRAYIPRDKSQGFASEPAIEWSGSIESDTVRVMAEKLLGWLPGSECVCEIWADEPTPDPRVFKLDTTGEMVSYVRNWSSRANVSLSLQRPSDRYPPVYVWATLRESAVEPADEVGVKLDRGLIDEGGVDLVRLLLSETKGPTHDYNIREFLSNFRERALS
jgi:hypothetical protein